MTGVGSIFTFTDSTYYLPQEVEEKYQSDVLWTGRKGFGDNQMRNQIIDELSAILLKQAGEAKSLSKLNIKIFGHDGKAWLGDPDYVRYINGAKIGIGSNSFNRRLYSSDRLGNYMACGTFYLAQYIEGIEEVFEKGVDMDWFSTLEEMRVLIDFYLENPLVRDQIAQSGRRKILKFFDTKPLTLSLLNIISARKKFHPWEEIYLN